MTDPVALLDGGLRQPDRRSCGASVLVAARMLAEPAYADRMTSERFAREALTAHRRVTGHKDVAGRLQVPWPRALGTPPWALARALSALASTRYVTRLGRVGAGGAAGRAATAVGSGRPVALYVGSRWLPRHVVLALPGSPAGGPLRVYEPSSGRMVDVTRERAAGHRLALAGWDRLWFVVLPADRRPPQPPRAA
jgi:hypothetical protein